MATILPYEHHVPKIHPDAWIACNATIIGDVEIEAGASIWFGCVLRGDVGPIRVGRGSNIQDLTCAHSTGGVSEVIIGQDVTVGHACILHGCVVRDRALVGMGSILLDNAEIGEEAVVGAGTLVTSRMVVPPRTLILGRPGKVLREVNEAERVLGIDGARGYQGHVDVYRSSSSQ